MGLCVRSTVGKTFDGGYTKYTEVLLTNEPFLFRHLKEPGSMAFHHS